MPHYILLSNLTDEGLKTIKEKPGRIKEVNKELEAFGVKVIAQYATLGPYDSSPSSRPQTMKPSLRCPWSSAQGER